MNKEYEGSSKAICRLSDWKHASKEDREGFIGVACVLAYMNGIKANVYDLSKHLQIPPYEIDVPFKRLLVNGIFSSGHDIKNDEVILGTCKDLKVSDGITFVSEDRMRWAWCWLAGVAAGLCGLKEN